MAQSQVEVQSWKSFYESNKGNYNQIRLEDLEHRISKFGETYQKQEGLGLDLGCGLISVFEYSDKNVIACDPLIDEYNGIVVKYPSRVEYVKSDYNKLPFKNEKFDWLFCINVIDHTPEPKELVKEMLRVLKKGGTLYFEVNFDKYLSPAHYDLWNEKMIEEDEYEEEDDPGYEAYECSEDDFSQVSKKLAGKFGFPERAVYAKKSESREERNSEEKKPYFPENIKFPKSNDKFYPKESDGVIHDSFVLKVISDRNSTGFEENKEFPIVMNSIVAGRYKIVEFLGSAAFSKAVQAIDTFTDEMVCLKIIENNKDYVDQSIDEIKLLLYIKENGDLDANNILKILDFFYHKEHLFIVTELLRDNLYEFYKYNREQEEEFYFTMGHLQRIAMQVLQGLDFLHSLKLIHCDLKPENILIKSYSRCLVKIIDLGSSCYIHDHLSSYVQSRSYRAPEVILGCSYDYRIDIWSLGCILAEL